jgi:MinD superfamily P-loop ATPase
MLTLCWSPKGGSGTTVVAASLAVLSARHEPTLLVDLGGDLPAALGAAPHHGAGVADWLGAPHADARRLLGLTVEAAASLWLLPLGDSSSTSRAAVDEPDRMRRLADAVAAWSGNVIVDLGTGRGPSAGWSTHAHSALVVIRACYLALQRAARIVPLSDANRTAAVLVAEPMRALGAAAVAGALGVEVASTVPFDPAIARTVDAGLLRSRLPAALTSALSSLVPAPGAAA